MLSSTLHAVGRHVAPLAVKICLPHIERIVARARWRSRPSCARRTSCPAGRRSRGRRCWTRCWCAARVEDAQRRDRSRHCRHGTWCGRRRRATDRPNSRSAPKKSTSTACDARRRRHSRRDSRPGNRGACRWRSCRRRGRGASWPAGPVRRAVEGSKARPIARPGFPCRRSRRPCGGTTHSTSASGTPSMWAMQMLDFGRVLGRAMDQ